MGEAEGCSAGSKRPSCHWKQGQLFAGPGAEPQAFRQPQTSGQTGRPQRRDLATPGESIPKRLRERAAEAGLAQCVPACGLSPVYCGGPRLMTVEMPTLRLSAVKAGPLQVSFYAWIQLEVYTAHR